ncbi:MAG: transposase [Nitrospirae bacterium]|nr:transposase [Nitrospirota bacterium]
MASPASAAIIAIMNTFWPSPARLPSRKWGTRSFCPSCHAKRSVVFAECVCDEVLEPVTHRHYVFSIPKILRTYFRYNRKLLGRLSRCAYETVKEMMQAAGLPLRDSNATGSGDNAAVPWMIAAIQTFGSDIDWHPHLHCLVINGAFTPDMFS